jgi:hypothetical protein
MKKHVISLIFAAVAALLLVVGCSDRGTNVPSSSDDGHFGMMVADHVFVDSLVTGPRQLLFQIGNVPAIMPLRIYYPRDTSTTSIPDKWKGKKMPLVVLLAPRDGDQYFYFNHGLMQLANEMIANGSIRPMVIACVPNNQVFGGYFYGDSDPAGHYDEIIGDSLVSHLQSVFVGVLKSDPAHQGIGGVGEGAYGAYRAALKHPGTFAAIAATDGPLDFDGDGGANGNGLIDLFPSAIAEQQAIYNPAKHHDSAYFYKAFDTSTIAPLSRMFAGGALAFSPHITATADSFYFVSNTRRTWLRITDTIPDTMTLITGCITGQKLNDTAMFNPGIGNVDWDFHLPFDGAGAKYDYIWNNYWLPNNLENIHTAGALSDVKLWFATTPQAELGYYGQTQSWIATLKAAGYPVIEKKVVGYDGISAINSQYLYDVMRDMLIFYSNSFGNN